MRPIEFRAKCTENGEWVCGDLHLNCNFPHIHTKERRKFLIDPNTIGQFTGIKEHKGNDVYEGDILMIEGIKYPRYHLVYWNERKFMFYAGDTPLYAYLFGDTLLREYVVCGNVYDNPGLLKAKL